MIYLQLFWNFCKIGICSIGGGYAVLPMIQKQIVEGANWLTMTEFSDVITISQMTPGPIALNAASFVGMRIAGIGGAAEATFGCIFPSFVIVLFVAYMYYKYRSLSVIDGLLYGIRPAVVALIASAGIGILIMAFWPDNVISLMSTDFAAAGIFAAGLVLLRIFGKKLNPIYVILVSGLVGIAVYSLIPDLAV